MAKVWKQLFGVGDTFRLGLRRPEYLQIPFPFLSWQAAKYLFSPLFYYLSRCLFFALCAVGKLYILEEWCRLRQLHSIVHGSICRCWQFNI